MVIGKAVLNSKGMLCDNIVSTFQNDTQFLMDGHLDKIQLKKFNPQIKGCQVQNIYWYNSFYLTGILVMLSPKLKIYAFAPKDVKIFIITDLDFLWSVILTVGVGKSELLKNKQKKQIFVIYKLKTSHKMALWHL